MTTTATTTVAESIVTIDLGKYKRVACLKYGDAKENSIKALSGPISLRHDGGKNGLETQANCGFNPPLDTG